MLFSLLYLLLRRVVRLAGGPSSSGQSKDLEILVLRHQLSVLTANEAGHGFAGSIVSSSPRPAEPCHAPPGSRSW